MRGGKLVAGMTQCNGDNQVWLKQSGQSPSKLGDRAIQRATMGMGDQNECVRYQMVENVHVYVCVCV